MGDVAFGAAFLFWTVVPGLLLVTALRLPWSGAERVAAAGGLSIALVSSAAYAVSALGLPMTPAVVGGLILAATGALALLARRGGPAETAEPTQGLPAWCRGTVPAWLPWLALVLPFLVVRQLEPMWSAGLLIPPTLHDGLDHAMWFRLILDAQSVLPSVVMAPPLAPDGSPDFYPCPLHAWLALVAGSSGLDPMAAFFRGLVGISALLPLSVYVFAARFTGRGWPALAAGALSLVFWWLPYQAWGWGGHALVAGAVASLPLSRLALCATRTMRPEALAAAAIGGVGLLLVHPSQAMAALVICTVASTTAALGAAGRWRDAVPFLGAFATAGLALTIGAGVWPPLERFLARASDIGAGLAGNAAYDWPGAVYANAVWQLPEAGRLVLGALYLTGAAVALRHAGLRALVAIHLAFSVMIPLAEARSWLTSFWYHAPERIWYLQFACLPVLGALGLGALVQLVGRAPGRVGRVLRPGLAWPLAVVVFLGGVRAGFDERATNFLRFYAHRTQPPLPTDSRLLDDFAWMSANVPSEELIFNASADWGLSVPFTGRRTVFWSGGYAVDPSVNWHGLQARLNQGDPSTSVAARQLAIYDIAYVYAAAVDPRWAVNGREALSVSALSSSAALEAVYASDTGTVFRRRPDAGQHLGLSDSPSIRFVEGFWSAESNGRRAWRWTNGRGVFQILPAAGVRPGCTIQLLGPDPDRYEVIADGEPLDLTPAGHRLSARVSASEPLTVEVQSPASIPAEADSGADDRLLGVRIFEISLDCPVTR